MGIEMKDGSERTVEGRGMGEWSDHYHNNILYNVYSVIQIQFARKVSFYYICETFSCTYM